MGTQVPPAASVVAHLDAIEALLSGLMPVYIGDVPDAPAYPYVLLWSSAGNQVGASIDDVHRDLEALVGVTVAATTPRNALMEADRVRGVLAAGGRRVALTVTGRRASLRLYDSRPVEVHRSVTLPGTNRHPAYVVDLYRVHSTPA